VLKIFISLKTIMYTVLLGHIVVSFNSLTHFFPLLHCLFTLYLDKNDNKNKKIQSDSITMEIKQLTN
jgi:hypothetical protein